MTATITLRSLAEEGIDAIFTVYCADSFDSDELLEDFAALLQRHLATAKRL